MTTTDLAAISVEQEDVTYSRTDREQVVHSFLEDVQLAARVAGLSFEEWPFGRSHEAILSSRIRSLDDVVLSRLAGMAQASGYTMTAEE